MKHIVLLGDSIFDNAAYVNGGPDITYEELIESLARLADAELLLHVAARKNWPSQN